ncbi:probable protein phosphatase 2C 67 isoform X1 [Ananas comosus]|uniref:protein-serine/threonine phosphatase n=1 Tax=Ananas comosus TaxID=4615 RepID=A0A6P5FGG6_ANACO|nr:probable protein phosphatase 2C 67 isoform X1 [Ananas comosus]XP_020095044.1 probable protein phosphatase 2C 67 isoform X1 [Ananas comosus]
MSYHKRDADVLDENSVTKRSKGSDTAVQDVEKERENRDIGIFAKSSTLSVEGNGRNGSVSQPECKDKDNRIPECRGSSEETIACDSKVSNEKDGKSTSIEADAAEDKGCRHTMEDAWVVLPDASSEYPGKLRCAHFAIYDGHGGRLAADFAQRHLHANVLAAGLPRELMDIKAAKKAILEGFRRTDESLLEESAKGNWQDGATAVCVWVLGQTVMVANIGDAKAVLARSSSADQRLKAIVLTREHKAIYTQERTRIQKAGGSVGSNGRLQGRLEVSRAFGDRQFKKVGVIATPDIHSFELTEKEQFIILGCDGLWGVFAPSDAVEFVQKQLEDTASATTAARHLVKEAIRERRCKDNCTAIVIVFKH